MSISMIKYDACCMKKINNILSSILITERINYVYLYSFNLVINRQ